MTPSQFRCIECQATYPLQSLVYQCERCQGLLEVAVGGEPLSQRSAQQWQQLFASRTPGAPNADGSGVWRYREWVLPEIAVDDIVTLGEGNSPLVAAHRLSEVWGTQILVKQCGHTQTGSFKDLGMTALVSHVAHMRKQGVAISAVACASTGDTSAALAAYGAAAGLRTLVLLPKGKVSAAQLVQPLSQGARVLSINTDFDGCMQYVQRLAHEEGVYLANSKNSLRLQGQKTVAYEMVQQLGWQAPDWVAIPGGNLGNVAALVQGFIDLQTAGIIAKLPRVLCAQAAQAAPLYQAFTRGFDKLVPVTAGDTQASAIRIGAPVSYQRAVRALQKTEGVVVQTTEQQLTEVAAEADQTGFYLCPHTAVAMSGVKQAVNGGVIHKDARVVVVSTAHGLKFTEFKVATQANQVAHVQLASTHAPIDVPDRFEDVRAAALGA